VLGFSLPDAAQSTLQASMGSRPVIRLTQQQPDPLNGDHQLQELLRLAAALEAKGDTAQFVRLWQQILVIREKQLGPEHLDIATSLNKLALLYRAEGRYGEAEPLYRRSLAIREKLLGPGHPDTATILNNLGRLLESQGRFGEAEFYYKRTLAIYENVLGPWHASTAISLNNLAALYDSQGRKTEAERLYIRSIAIKERVLGPDHHSTASSLNNLAALYQLQGRYREAEPLQRRDLAISEKVLGPEHPSTATSLNNLAQLYRAQGRYEEAVAISRRTLSIREKVLGSDHLSTALSLNNLAELYRIQGRYGEAEPLYQRSLAIYGRRLGPEHPDTAGRLNNLALLYFEMAKAPAAEPLVQRLNHTQANWLRRELPLQPRELRRSLIDEQPDASALAFALHHQSPTAATLALETRLNRQGLLAEIERRQALLKGSSPETRQLAEEVAGIDRQLSSMSLSQAQREPLRQQRQQLEAQLYRLLPALKTDPVTNAQVAAALRAAAPQGLLLEFQKYGPWRKGAKGQGEWGPPRYLALLLRPDGTIRAIALGEAAPIDAAVAVAVAASADFKRQAEAPERLAAVSRLVLAPLQRELTGVRELFISPDGELNRLPFAALPVAGPKDGGIADGPITADSKTLGDAVSLRLLTTGRDLLRLQQPAKVGAAPVLIANPDFNAASRSAKGGAASTAAGAGAPAVLRGGQQRSPGVRGLTAWQPLGGTEQEARQLAPLLGGGAVISGPAATAAVVLAQKAPRILHIATHGFFLADQPFAGASAGGGPAATGARGMPAASGGTGDGSAATTPSREDPLQRSGLVFAGANQPDANPNDDGYLTAAEATAMDLEGTELVTLSACETGLGGVRSGEGVYGLQRSLAVAGARSTLLSLWKVDDGLTATFMERYYNRLKAGEGRADALRDTQVEFRNNKNSTYNDIRVWGAFQLSGDWRALPKW
jgi:CHAT domain-containing protein/tetratricopeptide (TPR) repeat protein